MANYPRNDVINLRHETKKKMLAIAPETVNIFLPMNIVINYVQEEKVYWFRLKMINSIQGKLITIISIFTG